MKLLLSIDVLFLLLGMTSLCDGKRHVFDKKKDVLDRAGPQANEDTGKADHTSKSETENPSDVPSAIPSATPSRVPSTVPSAIPSSRPSASAEPSKEPSAGPTMCEDDLEWTLSAPGERLFAQKLYLEPLIGKDCAELQALVDEDKYEAWCQLLSQNSIHDKCALEACCFCGGGSHVEIPCTDKPEWSIDGLDCAFISSNSDPSGLCECFGGYSIAGLVPGDACCACGGGEKTFHSAYETLVDKSGCTTSEEEVVESRRRRKLQLIDGIEFTDNRYWIQDTTTRIGAGDSPGVPNLEYLGAGYNIVEGNPRGSFSSELDPGRPAMTFLISAYHFHCLNPFDRPRASSLQYRIPSSCPKVGSTARYTDRRYRIYCSTWD